MPGVARAAPLTNTAHLDFLGDTVRPPSQAGHSTFGSGPIGVLWTYADRNADGSYRRVGGGTYDPAANTYGQGAFNADDIARAAVVYTRHWRDTHSSVSRTRAYALLRGLAYLQSPNGNVVLWMQPDGTLNPSAEPVELPDPSDSGPSYWLARTVWAYGEGYRAFRDENPPFAQFLRNRLELALRALEREVLTKYPQTQVVDGRRVPSWLIVDGADATAEAMLGLRAYLDAGGSPAAARALDRFAEGVAAMGTPAGDEWPYGAVLPWAQSRSIWHAWASQMPAALAAAATTGGGAPRAGQPADGDATVGDGAPRAGQPADGDATVGDGAPRAGQPADGDAGATTGDGAPRAGEPADGAAGGRGRALGVAVADAASFTPHLLVAGGPQNGWNPSPSDGTQIAYGADSRLQSLLAVASAARRPGLRRLAGVAASWYFGNNPAGAAMYDPATGVTFDGVSADGTINRNSGAESTIHGLLSMLAIDAAPDVAAAARIAQPVARHTWKLLEAESATLAGGATVVTPTDSWTGESGWSGGAYARMPAGASVAFAAQGEPGLVEPVAFRTADRTGGFTKWGPLGTLSHVDAGAQGVSAIPGLLEIQTLSRPSDGSAFAATSTGTTALDGVLFQPLVESVTLAGDGRGQALARSFAPGRQVATLTVPGAGRIRATSYDATGREAASGRGDGATVAIAIPPGGFAIAER
ncbi:hypothetical protein [Solirubrobacter soli]|uniref:hypothetical protein n=1 Tax=Solirubrobacter soli TaxID=363832 RepID=UPI00069DA44E|nr:hypothetical protein [Solirubrobacter soli]